MSLVERHIEFVEALRRVGLPVSLSEGLDAIRAIDHLGIADRKVLRETYAATLVKRHPHRPAFDQLFDLYFPAIVGEGAVVLGEDAEPGASALEGPGEGEGQPLADGPQQLADFQEQLAMAMAMGDPDALAALAREGVQRFGLIRGRGPGQQRFSTYNVLNRVSPQELIDKALQGMLGELDADPAIRRLVEAQARVFEGFVEGEVRRRAAEVRGPEHVAQHTVRPSIDQLDFTAARKEDLVLLRREIAPLARRLATRLHRQQAAKRRGPLDFRKTVRRSLSSGGVPLETHHRPRRPGRPDLVVLCDVSGSVANFANFTLMLVFALQEQFNRVRAFMFVDDVTEVTDRFVPGGDPVEAMAALAAAAEHASLWGRTNYGRSFTQFLAKHPDALTPKTNLLILGDARSNYADLQLGALKEMRQAARKAWWLNPEHTRNWNTGDSAALEYGAIVPMIECRNLVQLGDFVRDLA